MDDIHVYLPNGMRVVIAQWDVRIHWIYARLQVRKWYGWSTLAERRYHDVTVTEIESQIDVIINEVLAQYEGQLACVKKESDANTRLQTIYHGKVRDVKCPR
ncbi:hypothetical protein [Brevibacillus daliensis]|uniref:hypothetical protein n=1 Tax=Brevibacillus daliensis TaxID=2892995 RepID=UPI001E5C33BF|nr:hypothetical protein [Brevibacillus daliensis]